jgi:hypothetical protein
MVDQPGDHHDDDRPHVVDVVNEAVSRLAPFSALILTIILVTSFLVRYYIFESFLMQRCYGDILFSAAQLFGAKTLCGMWLQQKKLRREQEHGEEHMAGIVMQVHVNSGSNNQIREVKDPPNPEGVAGASRL